jgi:SET domain-containing protein 6
MISWFQSLLFQIQTCTRYALVALAETALGGGRFPTTSLAEDVKRLKQLGPEQPGERERAGAGGWRARGRGGGGGDARDAKDAAKAGDYKPSWRDGERRAMHRARMALVVRVREKRSLKALGAWARHPCRCDDELLPPLVAREKTKERKSWGGCPPEAVCKAC